MVGGAGDPNHSAWGRVWVFFARKELVLEDFSSPAFTGVLPPKQIFRPKENRFIYQLGEISGRETPLWAAQELLVVSEGCFGDQGTNEDTVQLNSIKRS